MAIDYDKEPCPYGMHRFTPIIEGGQTVGLTCACGKSVREDMEHSSIVVTETGNIIEKINNRTFPAFDTAKRKDPRF